MYVCVSANMEICVYMCEEEVVKRTEKEEKRTTRAKIVFAFKSMS